MNKFSSLIRLCLFVSLFISSSLAIASPSMCGNHLIQNNPHAIKNPFLNAYANNNFYKFNNLANNKQIIQEYGQEAVQYLVFTGRPYLIQQLLHAGVSPNIPNSIGATVAFNAAMCGNIATLQVLKDAGANLNVVTQYNVGLITQALAEKQKGTVLYLMAQGVCPRSANRRVSDLEIAQKLGMDRIAYLIKHWHSSQNSDCTP